MNEKLRKKVQTHLHKAAIHLETALLEASSEWPNSIGFVSGEGKRAYLNVIESMDIREAQNGSPPQSQCVSSKVDDWDCGAW